MEQISRQEMQRKHSHPYKDTSLLSMIYVTWENSAYVHTKFDNFVRL